MPHGRLTKTTEAPAHRRGFVVSRLGHDAPSPTPRAARCPLDLIPGGTMRIRTTVLAALTAGLLLTGCSSSEGETNESVTYEAIVEKLPAGGIGRVDLLMPDATAETAEAGIRQYAKTIDGPSAVTISVVRTEDAALVVCRADWPDLDSTMNCPKPAGN